MSERTPYEQNYYPPVPSNFVKKARTNFFWQLWRFLIINLKVLRMVRKH
ncbi:MAG TPA: hypothetical protein PKV71_05630 [Calditrichia bacterium]|nr:hypothetical protein [Calditrichota bacterium]HQV31334.1 hypothetical protein [Calditrichia bacterium]